MCLRSGSVRLALCAMLIGTGSAWALVPHDKAVGPRLQQANEQQPAAGYDQTRSNDNERGTPALPLVIQSLPAPKTEKEALDDARERDAKHFNDEATLLIAGGTLFVLGVQTIVFGLQAHRLKQTIDAMEGARADQANSGQEASRLAARHAAAAEAAALAAQRSLTGAEAPYLYPILEHVPPKDDNEWPMLGTVLLRFGNFGRGPALVRASDITIVSAFNMPPVKSVKGQHFRFEHVLPAGVDQQLGTIAVGAGVETAAVDGVIPSRPLPLYVNGYIRYADLLGTEYVTELCQLYRPRDGVLRAIGGADRNRRREVSEDELAAMRALHSS